MSIRALKTLLIIMFSIGLGRHASAAASDTQSLSNYCDRQSTYLFFLTSKLRSDAIHTAEKYAHNIDATHGDTQKLTGFYRKALLWRQNSLPLDRFLQSIEETRLDFRSPSDRVLASVDGGFRQLPGYPNGQYAIVSFDVRFPSSPHIYTEQLTLERNTSVAQWRLVSYFMATKPFYIYQLNSENTCDT